MKLPTGIIPALVWYYARMKKGLPGYHGVYGKDKPVFVARWDRDHWVIFQGGSDVTHLIVGNDVVEQYVGTVRDRTSNRPMRMATPGALNVSLAKSISHKSKHLKGDTQ